MRRGPKPESAATKRFKGNPGNRPLNNHEPTPPAVTDLSPPDGLGEAGQRIWNETAPHLHALGLLTVLDRPLLLLYCSAWDEWTQAEEMLNEHGVLMPDSRGGLKPNPALRVRRSAADKIFRFGSDFGLSPSSRAGLRSTVATATHDPLEDLMDGRHTQTRNN